MKEVVFRIDAVMADGPGFKAGLGENQEIKIGLETTFSVGTTKSTVKDLLTSHGIKADNIDDLTTEKICFLFSFYGISMNGNTPVFGNDNPDQEIKEIFLLKMMTDP